MKHYCEHIKNPCDGYTYRFIGFSLPEKAKIFIDYVGGSNEKAKYKYYDGILEVTMPIFAVNPKFVNIGYEK